MLVLLFQVVIVSCTFTVVQQFFLVEVRSWFYSHF